MSEEDPGKIEKQQYLRENVMEKGHDIEKFVAYLQSVRENGDDVDNWTFDELKEVVSKFLKIESGAIKPASFAAVMEPEPVKAVPVPEPTIPTAEPNKPPYPAAVPAPVPEVPAAIPAEEVKVPKMSSLKRFNILREYSETLKTAELPTTELTTKKLVIKVLDPVIKQGGIFSSTTVNYVIETQPLGWKVQRTYADCMWLREQLLKFFPGFAVPPLNKKGAKNKTNSKAVTKRVHWLQRFFTELQRDQTLRSSDIFYQFCSLPQKPQFEAKKKEVTKLPAPKSIFELKHLTGKVETDMNERKFAMSRNVGAYAQNCQNLYSQLLVATDSTVKVMLLLSDSLARNADLYKQFAVLHVGVESAEMADLFSTMRGIHKSMGELYAKQAAAVKDKMGDFFRYYGEELDSLRELCATQEKISSDYLKREEQLYIKKEKLFNEGKVTSWDLMPEDTKAFDLVKLRTDKVLAMPLILSKDTKKLQDHYVNFAYYTNKLLEGARRMTTKNYRTMRKHFKETAEGQLVLIKKMHDLWREIADHFDTKISKLDKQERSAVLQRIKVDLGLKEEYVEVLA